MECKTVYYEHPSQNLNKIIINNDVQMSVGESCYKSESSLITAHSPELNPFASQEAPLEWLMSTLEGPEPCWDDLASSQFPSLHPPMLSNSRSHSERKKQKRQRRKHLLTPIPMAPCHADTHFPHVSHLLSLKSIQVSLDR